MAVDPLKFDNPLNINAVSSDEFPILFPAFHKFVAREVCHRAFLLLVGAIICVGGAGYFAHATPQHAIIVAQWSRLLMVTLTIAIIVRWESRSQVAFYVTTAVAVLCLCTAATSVFINDSEQPLIVTCSLTMLALLWTTAEIAMHFCSIDVKVIRRNPAIAQKRREQNSSLLRILAVLLGIAQCFALWTSMRLIWVPIAAMVAATVAYSLVAEIAKYPAKFLQLTLEHYLGYPEPCSLAPGLIRSSAPIPLFRLLPLVIVIVGSPLIPLADHETANVMANASLMAVCGLFAAITALMLGASLSARPFHFDVHRTSFDLVVSKLRAEENKNA